MLRREKRDYWSDVARTFLIGVPIMLLLGYALINSTGLVDGARQDLKMQATK